ncbi:hypothetical protein ACPOL_2037 [Acidisarcina polymorpha]|uniref:Uncharacterized protein n=1 Tax=Acidisarcina polymorpha TaxID=2211140 RepID=A0A2Z5FWV2_9BACT|nr:hypothetical protein ACPOL_2037 [Acidisarcina polymorpha]
MVGLGVLILQGSGGTAAYRRCMTSQGGGLGKPLTFRRKFNHDQQGALRGSLRARQPATFIRAWLKIPR